MSGVGRAYAFRHSRRKLPLEIQSGWQQQLYGTTANWRSRPKQDSHFSSVFGIALATLP
jgi:hypothetical protein